MKVLGLAGESGSGKNTVAGILTGILAAMGYRVGVDGFGAPLKWVCRARGWDGQPSRYWRDEMQRMGVEAREANFWSYQFIDRFPREHWATYYEMNRLEAIANDWNLDKFVYWLACRNGFGHDMTMRQWYELYPGDGFAHPDFLIIPDVRYPAEADFCQALGILAYLDGSHQSLPDDQRDHETESHLPALRDRGDHRFPYQESSVTAEALAVIMKSVDILSAPGVTVNKEAGENEQ